MRNTVLFNIQKTLLIAILTVCMVMVCGIAVRAEEPTPTPTPEPVTYTGIRSVTFNGGGGLPMGTDISSSSVIGMTGFEQDGDAYVTLTTAKIVLSSDLVSWESAPEQSVALGGRSYYLVVKLNAGSNQFDKFSNMNIACPGMDEGALVTTLSSDDYLSELVLAMPFTTAVPDNAYKFYSNGSSAYVVAYGDTSGAKVESLPAGSKLFYTSDTGIASASIFVAPSTTAVAQSPSFDGSAYYECDSSRLVLDSSYDAGSNSVRLVLGNAVSPVIGFNKSNGLLTDSYIDSDHLANLLSVLNATVSVENGLPKITATPELGAAAMETGSLVAGQNYYLIVKLSSGSDYFDKYSNMTITCPGSSGEVIALEYSNETYSNTLTLAIPFKASDYSLNINEEIKTENTVCYFNGDKDGNPSLADKRTLRNIDQHTVLTKGSVISYEANNIPNNSVSANNPAATSAIIYVDNVQVDSGALTGGDKVYVLSEDLAYEKCEYDAAQSVIKLYMYKPLKVTFNSNGRGFESYSIRVAKGEKVKRPVNPSAPRWSFDGWTTDKQNKKDYDFDTPVTESITLYAKWVLLNDIEASRNAALTPSVSGNSGEESETQALTNALFGNGGGGGFLPNVDVPDVFMMLQRTGLVLYEDVEAQSEETQIQELEMTQEEQIPEEPEYVDEIVVVPSPESQDMSRFKEIIVEEGEYTDSFPWFTVLIAVFVVGAIASVVVIMKNRKEWWDED